MKLVERTNEFNGWVSFVIWGVLFSGSEITLYEDMQRKGDGFVKAYIQGWKEITKAQDQRIS